jgi:prophage regulatory protein
VTELLRMRQVADLLDVSPRTVQRWVDEGRLPAPLVLSSRCLRWRESELLDWLESCRGQHPMTRHRRSRREVTVDSGSPGAKNSCCAAGPAPYDKQPARREEDNRAQ